MTPEHVRNHLAHLLDQHTTEETRQANQTAVSALEALYNWAEDDEFVEYFEPYTRMHPNVTYAMLTTRSLIELAAKILIPDDTERRDAFCTIDLSTLLH